MIGAARSRTAAVTVSTACAVGYRLLYLAELRRTPAFLQPVLDGAAHLEWARGVLAGTWPPPAAFFRAPGYVYWLAAQLAVLGDDPVRVAGFQLVLGAVTAGLTAGVAGRLFGTGAAWVAGIGAALYPMFAFFDAQLLAPALAIPLLLAAAWASLRALGGGGRAWVVGAALLWSMASVVRPPLLLAGLLLPVFLWRTGGAGRRGAAAALGVVLLLPLILTVRNAAVGDPAFIASQGGLNFYLGNNARANGMAATFPDSPAALGYRMLGEAARLAERAEGRALRSAEVSGYWRGRAFRDMAADPARWLGLELEKSVLFWGRREIPNNHDPVLVAEDAPLLRWTPGWWFWAPLGIVGFGLARRRTEARYIGAIVVMVFVTNVVFFVNARFRIPAAPCLIVLGSGALLEMGRRAGTVRKLAAPVAAALALMAAVNGNVYGIPRAPWVTSYVLVAEAESARGENVRALRWIEKALAIRPNLYAARRAQIDLLRKTGRVAEARAVAERAVQGLPGDAALRCELGALLELSGDAEAGLAQLDEAIRLDPAYDPAHVNRAIVLARLGRTEEATEVLRELLSRRPASPEASRAAAVLGRIGSGALGPG